MQQVSFSDVLLPQLERVQSINHEVIQGITESLYRSAKSGRFLMIAGSGHSAIFPMEFYHRAGGPSFVLPVVNENVLPFFGPAVARDAERRSDSLIPALDRVRPEPGEMLWIASQSGINPAIVELALEAERRGLETVAFTSLVHSRSVSSRHVSGKRLFEVCRHVIDLGGVSGDAAISVEGAGREISVGPLSTLTALFLGHSILSVVTARLESEGISCVYTSVNTPDGAERNRALELRASVRDDRLLKT